ncbi:cupin domain-containing protein [Pseudomonas sp. TE3610]
MSPPEHLYFRDDGRVPNNPLPALLYHRVAGDAAAFEQLFARHQWVPLWRDGIFDYHHYHSNAHEVLGVAAGRARVMLGGEQGQILDLVAGDVLVLPAGTGHCALSHSDDFLVVGAYPQGQEHYDIQRPKAATHHASRTRIAKVGVPECDPVSGGAIWA